MARSGPFNHHHHHSPHSHFSSVNWEYSLSEHPGSDDVAVGMHTTKSHDPECAADKCSICGGNVPINSAGFRLAGENDSESFFLSKVRAWSVEEPIQVFV
jgi:hypothetical protein